MFESRWRCGRHFYDRFKKPTEVQTHVAQPILGGKDVVVVAPTASGKTEAVVAPAVCRLLGSDAAGIGPQILYIAPTRALVADVVKRISDPVRKAGGLVQERTSDRKTWAPGRKTTILVTTPESFDSALARHPRALGDVRTVVIDEIHLMEGSPRALQLLLSTRRLELALGRPVQRAILSATMPDMDQILQRWTRDGVLVRVHGAHDIHARALVGRGERARRALEIIYKEGYSKVLCFSNARVGAEVLAQELQEAGGLGWTIRAHHGNMDGADRKQTERLFREGQRVIVCATSTLEVGIDVGDVDVVVLDGAPHGLNSFLQRLGRGCRRSDVRRVLCLARDAIDVRVFEALIGAAREGRSDGQLTRPLLAVWAQQVGAALLQQSNSSSTKSRVFLSHRTIQEILAPCLQGVASEARDWVDLALESAELVGYARAGVSTDGETEAAHASPSPMLPSKAAQMGFHVTFTPSVEVLEVRIQGSNSIVGHIAKVEAGIGDLIHLGGRTWRVVQRRKGAIIVVVVGGGRGAMPKFTAAQIGLASEQLAAKVGELVWRDWMPGRVAVFRSDKGWEYAHFLGHVKSACLAELLRVRGLEVTQVTPYSLLCNARLHESFVPPDEAELRAFASHNPEVIETFLDPGRLYRSIRENLGRIQAHIALDWAALATTFAGLSFVDVSRSDLVWEYQSPDSTIGL